MCYKDFKCNIYM